MRIDLGAPIEAVTGADGTVTLTGLASSGATRSWAGELNRPGLRPGLPSAAPARRVATPYYRWANRGASPMRAWSPVSAIAEGSRAVPRPVSRRWPLRAALVSLMLVAAISLARAARARARR